MESKKSLWGAYEAYEAYEASSDTVFIDFMSVHFLQQSTAIIHIHKVFIFQAHGIM